MPAAVGNLSLRKERQATLAARRLVLEWRAPIGHQVVDLVQKLVNLRLFQRLELLSYHPRGGLKTKPVSEIREVQSPLLNLP